MCEHQRLDSKRIWKAERERQSRRSVFLQQGRWCSIIGSSWPLGRKQKDRLITPFCKCFINMFCIVSRYYFVNYRLIFLLTCHELCTCVLYLQVSHPWFLCWHLPERRTSRGSTCCCVKRSWQFISPCSSMVWALTAAMNSSAWQLTPSTTVCGLLSLGEGQKSLLSQRGPRPHQVAILFHTLITSVFISIIMVFVFCLPPWSP